MDAQQTNKQNLELIIRDLQQRVQLLETSSSIPGITAPSQSGGFLNGTPVQGLIELLPGPEDSTHHMTDPFGITMPALDVTVGPSGRLLVTYGAALGLNIPVSESNVFQAITLEVGASGANVLPVATSGIQFGLCRLAIKAPISGSTSQYNACISRQVLLTKLAPGLTHLQMYYFIQGTIATSGVRVIDTPYITASPL